MTKVPITSGSKIIKAYKKQGFRVDRQKGSHVIMVKDTPNGRISFPVPLYNEIDRNLLRIIIKQSKVKTEDFLKYLFIFLFRK